MSMSWYNWLTLYVESVAFATHLRSNNDESPLTIYHDLACDGIGQRPNAQNIDFGFRLGPAGEIRFYPIKGFPQIFLLLDAVRWFYWVQ